MYARSTSLLSRSFGPTVGTLTLMSWGCSVLENDGLYDGGRHMEWFDARPDTGVCAACGLQECLREVALCASTEGCFDTCDGGCDASAARTNVRACSLQAKVGSCEACERGDASDASALGDAEEAGPDAGRTCAECTKVECAGEVDKCRLGSACEGAGVCTALCADAACLNSCKGGEGWSSLQALGACMKNRCNEVCELH